MNSFHFSSAAAFTLDFIMIFFPSWQHTFYMSAYRKQPKSQHCNRTKNNSLTIFDFFTFIDMM